jgi:hypothetical protein
MEDEAALLAVYAQFRGIFANSKMMRTPVELAAAIRAGGLSYKEVTHEWLANLSPEWVYRESAAPFQNDDFNRAYWRMVT